ncbi:MAG: DUF4433 domain-containing protein [Thermoplasmata archaeon]|nr:DUF4433 domain-containing protein [Thermoplasmata archaeon]
MSSKKYYLKYLKQKGIEYFNYITHFLNLIIPVDNQIFGILVQGILPRNVIQSLNIQYSDISIENVQNLRRDVSRDIHDYVPLYFATHTPMLYDVYEKFNYKESIVIIKIDLRIFEKRKYFTDMNIAYPECNFYKNEKDLEKLNWKIINTKKCYTKEYKKYKQAELLVNEVPPSYFKRILFSNEHFLNSYKKFVDELINENKKYDFLKNYLNMMEVDRAEFPII